MVRRFRKRSVTVLHIFNLFLGIRRNGSKAVRDFFDKARTYEKMLDVSDTSKYSIEAIYCKRLQIVQKEVQNFLSSTDQNMRDLNLGSLCLTLGVHHDQMPDIREKWLRTVENVDLAKVEVEWDVILTQIICTAKTFDGGFQKWFIKKIGLSFNG